MTEDIEAYEKLRQRTLGPFKNKDTVSSPMKK